MFFVVVLTNPIISFGGKMNFNNDGYLFNKIESTFLLPFLSALKNGEVDKFKEYLSPELYKKYEKLIENNKGYSTFLKNYYKNVIISVKKIESYNGQIFVTIEFDFLNGNKSSIKFLLKRTSYNSWKIFKEM